MKGLRYLRPVVRWVVPAAVLLVVLLRVDLAQAAKALWAVHVPLVLAGLAYYPAVVVLGAWRWRTLSEADGRQRVGYPFFLKHYWIGLAVGVFAPASIGWDVYRAAAVSRRCGHPASQVRAIVHEKAVALLNAVLMAVVLYPVILHLAGARQADVGRVVGYAGALGAACALGLAALAVALRSASLRKIVDRAERWVRSLLGRVELLVGPQGADAGDRQPVLGMPRRGAMPLLEAFGLSLMIQVVAALGNQLIFRAMGHPVPLVVNLFLMPLFFLAFLVPVSFGGLGIREGLYVLFYGWFGVAPEIALAASFINLAGTLFNCVIGAAFMALQRGPDGGQRAVDAVSEGGRQT